MNRASIYNLRQTDGSSARESTGQTSKTVDLPQLSDVEHVQCLIRPKNHIILPNGRNSAASEQLKLFDHRLAQIRLLQPFKSTLVTSPVPGEGKTLVAVNLAITMARTSRRVLLIDGDIRRGDIAHRLCLPRKQGLVDILEGKSTLAESLQFLESLNLFFLSSGECGEKSDLLNTVAARELFRQLHDYFEILIVDSCPVLPFSDTHRLAVLTDAIVIVTRENVSRRAELADAVAALSNHRLLGIVINSSTENAEREYHYYKYYRR